MDELLTQRRTLNVEHASEMANEARSTQLMSEQSTHGQGGNRTGGALAQGVGATKGGGVAGSVGRPRDALTQALWKGRRTCPSA